MKPTALGHYLAIVPQFGERNITGYLMVSLNKHGNWTSATVCATREAAQQERAKLRKWHKTLHAQREARRRKRGEQ